MRAPRPLLVLGLVACLVAVLGTLLTVEAPTTAPQRRTTGAWVSSPTDAGRRLLPVRAQAPGGATASVRVDPGARRQTWRGVGGALTDASVELLGSAPDGVRRLFDPRADDGAHLDWVRLPLTATDMSPQAWTWGWDGTTASPHPRAEQAVAEVKRLLRLRPDLQVVATPWTAPSYMKTPAGVRGGALRDDAVDQYAAMLLAQVDALRGSGVPVAALTLGNEPGYSADYPSMTMTDEQMARLGRALGPELDRRDVQLWAVDHNWADRPRVDAVLAGAPGAFDAAAFHCYRGTASDMAGVGVPPVVDECTGTTSSWREGFSWDSRHLVTESLAAGSTGLVMWNLAVDPSGGPRDLASRAGCASCRGLVTVAGRSVDPGPEFYVLAHLARAADPGARVLGTSASAGVDAAAFTDPDGTVGVFVHNGTGRDRVVAVRVAGRGPRSYAVRDGELLTVRLPAP